MRVMLRRMAGEGQSAKREEARGESLALTSHALSETLTPHTPGSHPSHSHSLSASLTFDETALTESPTESLTESTSESPVESLSEALTETLRSPSNRPGRAFRVRGTAKRTHALSASHEAAGGEVSGRTHGEGESVRHGRGAQNALTAAVALIVTAASATGMWNYFGDVLHISNTWARAALFSVIELSLLVSALRARRHRIDYGRAGVDDAAVWVLAVLTGALAATDEHTPGAVAGRLALPLVAAWLFERAISAERSDSEDGKKDAEIHWRVTPERVAVWLRLADAQDRGVAEVDRARSLARLARIAYRAHTARLFRALEQRRLRRRLATANETLGLVSDPLAVDALRAGVALLYEAVDRTTRAAVASASPWPIEPGRPTEPDETTDRVPDVPPVAPVVAVGPSRSATAEVPATTTPPAPDRKPARKVAAASVPAGGSRVRRARRSPARKATVADVAPLAERGVPVNQIARELGISWTTAAKLVTQVAPNGRHGGTDVAPPQ
jgi:hypothetical protein